MELAHHQYLMSTKRSELMRSPQICSNWEEKAFADDTSGVLGGIVWPPRFYSCSFCNREFKSAQALGGHMNVHRRDRARLKQSLISVTGGGAPDNTTSPGEVQVLQHIHHQNPNFSSPLQLPIKSKVSNFTRPDETSIDGSHVPSPRYPFSSTDHDGTALCIGMNNNNSVAGTRPGGNDARPGFKRHKSDTTSLFSHRLHSGDLSCSLQLTTWVKFGNSMEDLDLELRLGDAPKVK